jgi:hypothetical protein
MLMIKNWTFPILLVLMLVSGQILAEERLQLDETSIVGSKELPKVIYIVPWKSTNIMELGGMSDKGSFSQSMQALDRDVFRKELDYFSMLEGTGREAQP